jgi:hypothetical protein
MNVSRVLLEETLALLRLAEEAPLAGQIDAPGMAAEIERRAEIRLGGREGMLDWGAVQAGLDALLGVASPGVPCFAPWLSHTHARLRDAHPRAAAVAALRLAGFDDRDIAGRLGLGPRLVGRIR